MRKKWEYLTSYDANMLDEYGAQGWELVSVTAEEEIVHSYGEAHEKTVYSFFFKREVE